LILNPSFFLSSYAEAHKIKLKADALEAWELEKWHSERQQDLLQKEAKFKFNKQQELVALQKRIQTGREEQKKQRHLDLERLLQRYQNVKAELEAQQNLERIRMEKMVASGGVAGFNASVSTKRSGSKSMKRGASINATG
jgi:predicted NodU family carbamoyl transferase